MAAVKTFDEIYLTNAWAGGESRSGPGSGRAATERVTAELVGLVFRYNVESVLDVGCGDGFWMPDLPGYVGIDASAVALELAFMRHPGRDYRLAGVRDLAESFDLVICRDAIQHLSFVDGLELLAAIRATGSRRLLASTFVDGENVDIRTGDSYAPDLTAPPFGLGQPDEMIFDGWSYTDSSVVRDPRKHLGLWRLAS